MDSTALKNRLFLITGIMASGKSTVAELLARQFEKGVHLRGDLFRRMIVSGREEMGMEAGQQAYEQLYLRYRITAAAAKQYMEAGFNVVVQDNYYGKALTDMLGLLLPYPAEVVVLNPGIDTVAKREKERNKKGYIGFDIQRLYETFISETPRTGYWIDTSDLTPEQTVRVILSHTGLGN